MVDPLAWPPGRDTNTILAGLLTEGSDARVATKLHLLGPMSPIRSQALLNGCSQKRFRPATRSKFERLDSTNNNAPSLPTGKLMERGTLHVNLPNVSRQLSMVGVNL